MLPGEKFFLRTTYKNLMTPKVSVITTVYNCENYIARSVQSILDQTFTDFEYIVVNDGSSDNTCEIVKTFTGKDSRVILIDNKINKGRVPSLNTALAAAKGKYIAIQDADDISLDNRLEKQYNFLENNPDYVLVGANIIVMDENENKISEPLRPEENLDAKYSLLFRCTFANPSIMYRKKTLDENNIRYEDNFIHAEDFRIISLLSRFGKIKNLRETMIMYRKHPRNNSMTNMDIMDKGSIQIVMENLSRIGFEVNYEQANRFRNMFSSRGINKLLIYEDVELLFEITKTFSEKYNSSRNKEIQRSLRRMMNWLGKTNVMTRSRYFSLFISILNYYIKHSIFK